MTDAEEKEDRFGYEMQMRVSDRGSITTVHHRCSIMLSTQALEIRKSKGLAPLCSATQGQPHLLTHQTRQSLHWEGKYLQPAALLLLGHVMHTTRSSPCLQQSSFTQPHPPGKLHLLIGLDDGTLLCHCSMCPTSACPRDSGQNNQEVLLTPLPMVTKTPFLSFQRGKHFWSQD